MSAEESTPLPTSSGFAFVAGAVAWIVFGTALTLVFRVGLDVMSVGGFCARGGPYQIQTECSDTTVVLMPIAIPAMLFAVFGHAIAAKGWGPSLAALFWPTLFTVLGVAFLRGSQLEGYSAATGYVVGGMFLLMSGTPLLLLAVVRRGRAWSGWSMLGLRDSSTSTALGLRVVMSAAGKPTVIRDHADDGPQWANIAAGMVFLAGVTVVSIALADYLYALP